VPILVLIGDQDIINNNKSIEKAKRLLPIVEVEKIKNAGHFLSIDQPEIVNKRILDFLNLKSNLTLSKKTR
jgi:pimeloyl-ACP methyl ester carboxylesterase